MSHLNSQITELPWWRFVLFTEICLYLCICAACNTLESNMNGFDFELNKIVSIIYSNKGISTKAKGTMKVAALGRQFHLGMLYDCRGDTVIPEITLWGCDDLEKDRREQECHETRFEIVASESIEDKSSALNIDASLKASFLGGLFEVGGSARYLDDQKTSKNQARVTLKYKCTTKIQKLSMTHLGRGNVMEPYVFEKGIATHVVTGILYGAQAFFVFDCEVSEEEDHQNVLGNLMVMIKKIPFVSIEGEGSLKIEHKKKSNVEKFSCRFYGDFSLQKPPTTFQEAVEVCKSLPTLLGASGEKPVPMKVWLLPLTSLDSCAAKLVHQISTRLVQESQSVLEDLSELEMRCNDAMRTSTVQQFPEIGKKLTSFKEMCSKFKLEFQEMLGKRLPSIRGGEEEEAELAEVLKKRHSSPFNSKCLNEWMDCKEREISILKSFTKMKKKNIVIPCLDSVHEELLSAEQGLCFVFVSLGNEEPYLSALSNYLTGRAKTDVKGHHIYDVEKEQWNLSKEAAFGPDPFETLTCSPKVCITTCKFARLAEYLKHISTRTNSGVPSVYKLPLKEVSMEINGCQRYMLGKESRKQNRTIMLLGATGSGKSTLINGMINYIVGVEWNDSFRFKLVDEDPTSSQAHSQTSEVTVYEIHHQEGFKIPFSITLVDTPGFGDTRGAARDKEITKQIHRLFISPNGVCEIDAVCFVTQASLARLTATQRYVLDSVLSIFGKDVVENIKVLVTFADGRDAMVLEAMNVAGVPCPKNELGLPVHFKFNNSALFADNTCNRNCKVEFGEDDPSFEKMFWKMGAKSMERFFTSLGKMETKSLLMTKEVLKERKQLEIVIEGFQPQVRAGLAKLEQIKATKEKLKEHKAVITLNENFKIEVDVIKPVQKPITAKGAFITNCQKCSITCHYPCTIAQDDKKRHCKSMDRNGMCTICPGKCIWSVHFNQTYSWEYVEVKEKLTVRELKHRYEKATEEKMTIQELIERQEEESVHLQDMIVSLIDQSAYCITRLQEISLRPNPLTTVEYIDMLIEGERSEAKEGYQARIKSLETMKERAKPISKVPKRDRLKKPDEEFSKERQKKKENNDAKAKF